MKKTNKNEKIALKFLQIAMKISKSVLKSPDTLLKNANFVIQNNEVILKIMINGQATDDVVSQTCDENRKIDKNTMSEFENCDSSTYRNNEANSLKENNLLAKNNQNSDNFIGADNFLQDTSTLSSNLSEIGANEQKSLKKSKKQIFLDENTSFDKQDNTSKVVDFPTKETILVVDDNGRLLLPVLDQVDINPGVEGREQNGMLRGNFVDSIRADLSHK